MHQGHWLPHRQLEATRSPRKKAEKKKNTKRLIDRDQKQGALNSCKLWTMLHVEFGVLRLRRYAKKEDVRAQKECGTAVTARDRNRR